MRLRRRIFPFPSLAASSPMSSLRRPGATPRRDKSRGLQGCRKTGWAGCKPKTHSPGVVSTGSCDKSIVTISHGETVDRIWPKACWLAVPNQSAPLCAEWVWPWVNSLTFTAHRARQRTITTPEDSVKTFTPTYIESNLCRS